MSNGAGQFIGEIQSVPQTLSSWDACMSKVWCKWPVIVGIVIGGIVLLSILWCLASCICCGASLCASCTRCLTCFGCCGMCGSTSNGRKKPKDDYAQMPPTPYNGYQAPPANMSYRQPTSHRGLDTDPQFATFDESKSAKMHEDNLPSMPTWASATSRRVEDHTPVEKARGHGDDVEMGRMATSPPPMMAGQAPRGMYSEVPNNGPISPMTPPVQQAAYFNGQAHPYQSDLGAQRMPHEDYNNSHRYGDDFQNIPMSPAPTYTSQPPAHMIGAAATTDDHRYQHSPPERYVSPIRSPMPMPEDYNRNHLSQQQPFLATARSPSPYAPSQSTQYEVSDPGYHSQSQSHALSPQDSYGNSQYQSYSSNQNRYSYEHTPQILQGSGRPPSLLQVGRKPVVGSHREV